jgi:hypothetical protein
VTDALGVYKRKEGRKGGREGGREEGRKDHFF